ncbi:MAG TPA: hypothetical protein VK614_07035 [Allosphingosinicella sp.]|nr:hypothetical protein [Allosphingosinicella sp.]
MAVAASATTPMPASGRNADLGYSASVFTTVGHSEWCPPGTVRLNLGAGRYAVRAPRTWRACRRPAFPTRVRTAVLAADELAAVRAAYQRAASEGLAHPACRNGGRPERIVISNGGTPILRLTERARTISPPRDRNCWSDAALRLHRLLNDMFRPRGERAR